MILNALRRSAGRKHLARRLCLSLLTQARQPAFFSALGVPDTMDGRFDLVILHAWLVLDLVKHDRGLAQLLTDEIFISFDEALRELGTGDVGMNRRLKAMASAFYGRLQAYRQAGSPEALADAIHRNLYRGDAALSREAAAIAAYALSARSHLENGKAASDNLEFGPLPII